jgi:hypothetical protein
MYDVSYLHVLRVRVSVDLGCQDSGGWGKMSSVQAWCVVPSLLRRGGGARRAAEHEVAEAAR